MKMWARPEQTLHPTGQTQQQLLYSIESSGLYSSLSNSLERVVKTIFWADGGFTV